MNPAVTPEPSQSTLTRRAALGLGATSALGLMLAGCAPGQGGQGSGPASEGRPVRGGRLVYPANFDVRTLDPAFSANFSERFVYYAIYNSLVSYSPSGKIVPELAQRWETNNGGRVLTLTLRPNVKFHDGTACDAAAVKWNLDRIMNPATESPLRSQLTPPLEKVTAVGATTVRLELSVPWRPLLATLGERPGFIVSPTAVKRYGDDYGAKPVGTGPFKVASYAPGNQLTLTRFDGYWKQGEPYLDEIKFTHAPDAPVQLTQLRAGEAHIVNDLEASLLPTIQQAPGVMVLSRTSGSWCISALRMSKAPFDNLDFRRAISHATDRKAVVQSVFRKQARIASEPIGAGWAYDKASKPPYPFDLNKARSSINSANVQGQRVPFVNSSRSQYQAVAQALLESYSKIGIKVDYGTVPAEDYFPQVKEGKILWSVGLWTPRADPDGLLRILFHSDGFQNTSGFSNARVDRLLDEAAQELDINKAAPLYHEIQHLVESDANTISVVWPNAIVAHRENLHGIRQYPDGILRFRDMWLS